MVGRDEEGPGGDDARSHRDVSPDDIHTDDTDVDPVIEAEPLADDDTDHPDPALAAEARRATRQKRMRWLRRGLLTLVGGVLAVEAYLIWPSLSRAWENVGQIDWWWMALCVVAAALSMDSFAQVQRVLLKSAGVTVRQRDSAAVVYSANSMATTLPGGLVMAPAFTYRQTRKWGATPVVASWQVVMSGLLQGVGLAVLGFGGALLAGATKSPFSIIFSLAAFGLFIVVAQYFAGHPESIYAIGVRLLRRLNDIRDKPADYGITKWGLLLDQLRAVELERGAAAKAFGWSLFNWVADVVCLAAACWAVGGEPSIAGLMVAYAASKAVGSAVPFLPGGIGILEPVLLPALISSGMTLGAALTAILLYRIVSLVLVAIVGWIIFLIRYQKAMREPAPEDPDDEGPAFAR